LKTEKIVEEVKMWQKSPKSLTQKDRVGMHIANPDLIVQTKALKERMNRNPKSPLEKIFKYNDVTGSGSGTLCDFDALQPPSSLSWSTPRLTS
jgi:hypothetical protein